MADVVELVRLTEEMSLMAKRISDIKMDVERLLTGEGMELFSLETPPLSTSSAGVLQEIELSEMRDIAVHALEERIRQLYRKFHELAKALSDLTE